MERNIAHISGGAFFFDFPIVGNEDRVIPSCFENVSTETNKDNCFAGIAGSRLQNFTVSSPTGSNSLQLGQSSIDFEASLFDGFGQKGKCPSRI